MAEKKSKFQLKPAEISVDEHGKVVVNNAEFAKALAEELKKAKKGEPQPLGFIKIDIIC